MNKTDIITLLRRLSDAFRETKKSVAAELNLQPIAYDIIMFLAENSEFDTAKDIRKSRLLKANTISFHVERLVADGYLERKKSEGDRRTVRLVCTEKAQCIIDRGRKAQNDFEAKIRNGIPQSDLERLDSILATIDRNLYSTAETSNV